jgi:hypothetical protein
MKSDNCNPYEGGEVPPCYKFLGNINPIIIDGQLIFRNDNRVYYFISTSSTKTIQFDAGNNSGGKFGSTGTEGFAEPVDPMGPADKAEQTGPADPSGSTDGYEPIGPDSDGNTGICSTFGNTNTVTNLQISLPTYIIGLYIHEVQLGNIIYSEKNVIHSDKRTNAFIHKTLKRKPVITVDYIPSLSLVMSNSTAILNFFTNTINITPLNYFILFVLNRLENHPGLFFGNNAYITEDPINFTLASLSLRFPLEQ